MGWVAMRLLMIDDPRVELQRAMISSESTDRHIEWSHENSGYDLYAPRSAAAQLGTSLSYFNDAVRTDSGAPVITG